MTLLCRQRWCQSTPFYRQRLWQVRQQQQPASNQAKEQKQESRDAQQSFAKFGYRQHIKTKNFLRFLYILGYILEPKHGEIWR
jgi:hypothetical protein